MCENIIWILLLSQGSFCIHFNALWRLQLYMISSIQVTSPSSHQAQAGTSKTILRVCIANEISVWRLYLMITCHQAKTRLLITKPSNLQTVGHKEGRIKASTLFWSYTDLWSKLWNFPNCILGAKNIKSANLLWQQDLLMYLVRKVDRTRTRWLDLRPRHPSPLASDKINSSQIYTTKT